MSSINSWLRCNGTGKLRDPQVLGVIPHDMYVIGTQESALTEKDWVNFVKNHIKSCLRADVEMVRGDNSNWHKISFFLFIILEWNILKLEKSGSACGGNLVRNELIKFFFFWKLILHFLTVHYWNWVWGNFWLKSLS